MNMIWSTHGMTGKYTDYD